MVNREEKQNSILLPAGKENIWNLPNFLSFSRIIIAFVVIYFILADFPVSYIIIFFIIGMLTDFFDGQIAKRFNLKTEFGRKLDMVADRIFMFGVVSIFILKFSLAGVIAGNYIFQLIFTMSREIITIPISLVIMAFRKEPTVQVRFIGKLTTTMETITFSMLLLTIFYDFLTFSVYFAVISGIIGLISSGYYIYDIRNILINRNSVEE